MLGFEYDPEPEPDDYSDLDPNEYARNDYCIGIKVERIKINLHIDKENRDMDDDEVRLVCREFGKKEESDTPQADNGQIGFRIKSYKAMLIICLYYFPRFYEKHRLSQYN